MIQTKPVSALHFRAKRVFHDSIHHPLAWTSEHQASTQQGPNRCPVIGVHMSQQTLALQRLEGTQGNHSPSTPATDHKLRDVHD